MNTTRYSAKQVELTPKQEKFAQNVADGMTQADAYRHSYNAAKMKPSTVQENASRLMAEGKVSARVRELKEALTQKNLWTREMSVKALVQAYKEGAPSVKVSAVKELNAMHGYNEPMKIDHMSRDGSMSPTSAADIAIQTFNQLNEGNH